MLAEALWRLLPGVRTAERPRFLFFFGLHVWIAAAGTLGLVGTEAIFLGRIGADSLPETFVGASILTVALSMIYANVVGRARNDGLFTTMLVIAGVTFIGGGAMLGDGSPALVIALFCGWFAADAIFLNHYWTFTGDFFDTLQSKRLFPLINLGSSIGGATGGAAGALLAATVDSSWIVLVWGLLLVGVGISLRLARSRIRRWGPLGYEEADETSVEGLRAAVTFAQRSSMGRFLILAALGMVIAIFASQYLYSQVFQSTYPDPKSLAAFFGAFLLVSNLLEIAVALWLTPFLIRRFGVASANLAHPLTTLLSFVWLAVDFSFAAAIAARANSELLDDAVAEPTRNLVYNALPLRLRGRMRALLEGVVIYSGMAVAGLVLMAATRSGVDLTFLAWLGVGMAALYFVANLRVRRAYLESLVTEMRAGRLELRDMGAELGNFEVARLAELWQGLLARGTNDGRGAAAAMELAPLLASRGLIEPLQFAARHQDAGVRESAVRALTQIDSHEARSAIVEALTDPEASVREVAAHGLRTGATGLERAALRAGLEDPVPAVRAEAAHSLGEEGRDALGAMARSADPIEAAAALQRLGGEDIEIALARVTAPEDAIRAAALGCIVRCQAAGRLAPDTLHSSLEHADPALRRAALEVLGAQSHPDALPLVAECLDDRDREIRTLAADLLGLHGEAGVDAAAPYLDGRGPWTVDAAHTALQRTGSARGRAVLVRDFRGRVAQAWDHLLAIPVLASATDPPGRFLSLAHANALTLEVRHAFRILELLEGATVVRSVQRTLRLGGSRARADALEVLSNLGDRAAASLLALLHETGPLDDRIRGMSEFADRPRDLEDVMSQARDSQDRWVRVAAGSTGGPLDGETRTTMERLLALREVPIFAELSLDQLETIGRAMQNESYVQGEVVVREGDPGSKLYLVLEGEVEIYVGYQQPGEQLVNRMSAVCYFGEMAVLDDERRTATAVVSRDARLAALSGDRLKELILQMPEMSFELFRQLIERVRDAERRVAEIAENGKS